MSFATPDSNLVLIILTALINLFTAYIAHRTRGDVHTLEKNTNSKMDSLLALTAKSSKAEGVIEGKKERGDG